MALTVVDQGLLGTNAQYTGFKNRIINGAMVISQRGTTINSISSDGSYTADRWYINRGGTIDYTQSTSSPPTGFQYYASYINQSAGNPFLGVIQVIESINSFDLLGQTVTISVWLKAAANTAGSTAVTLSLGTATTANAKKTTDVGSTAFTISSSVWTKCTISVAVPSNALSISPSVSLGTMAVGDGVFVTGFQLEKGSTATSFDYRPYGTELALCQRYFYNLLSGVNTWAQTGYYFSSTQFNCPVLFPTQMRAAPALTINTGASYYLIDTSSTHTLSSLLIYQPSKFGTLIYGTPSLAGVAGTAAGLVGNNASSYIGFTAEL